ncbi:hypothetical protein M432DRAFT_153649 [Thermoascus aurantiacus ATCC 26904]
MTRWCLRSPALAPSLMPVMLHWIAAMVSLTCCPVNACRPLSRRWISFPAIPWKFQILFSFWCQLMTCMILLSLHSMFCIRSVSSFTLINEATILCTTLSTRLPP